MTNASNAAGTEGTVPADYVPAFTSPSRPDSWAARNRNLFASDESFRWFTRRHRRTLTTTGALLWVGGRWFINPQRWPEAFEACVRRDTLRAADRIPEIGA